MLRVKGFLHFQLSTFNCIFTTTSPKKAAFVKISQIAAIALGNQILFKTDDYLRNFTIVVEPMCVV